MTKRKLKPIVLKSQRRILDYRYRQESERKLHNGLRSLLSFEGGESDVPVIMADIYAFRANIRLEWWGPLCAMILNRVNRRGRTTVTELVQTFIRNSR